MMAVSAVWVQPQRLVMGGQGILVAAQPVQRHTPSMMAVSAVWVQPQRLVEYVQGILVAAQPAQ